MENGQRNPENKKGEAPNETAKSVGKDHATAGTRALRRASISLIEHLVQSIEHTANSDNDVSEQSIFCLIMRFADRAICSLLAFVPISIRDDKNPNNRYHDGKHFVKAKLVVEEGYGERIGKEGGAVVDRGQVTGRCHVDRDIPRATGYGEGGGDERGRFEHVSNR